MTNNKLFLYYLHPWPARIIAFLLFLAIFFFGYTFNLHYQFDRVLRARGQLSKLQAELNLLQQQINATDSQKMLLEQTEQRFTNALSILPYKENAKNITSHFIETGERHHLEFINVKVSSIKTDTFPNIQSVELAISGTYYQIEAFIADTIKSHQIALWRNLSLSRQKPGTTLVNMNGEAYQDKLLMTAIVDFFYYP